MIVKREVSVNAYTTDGKVMEFGKKYAFEVTENKVLAGIYTGISKKGALMFESFISGFLVSFNVMPASILTIYEAEIDIRKDEE